MSFFLALLSMVSCPYPPPPSPHPQSGHSRLPLLKPGSSRVLLLFFLPIKNTANILLSVHFQFDVSFSHVFSVFIYHTDLYTVSDSETVCGTNADNYW